MKEAVEKENHPSSSSSSCSSSGEEDESPRHSCPEGQYCEVEDDEEKKSMEVGFPFDIDFLAAKKIVYE